MASWPSCRRMTLRGSRLAIRKATVLRAGTRSFEPCTPGGLRGRRPLGCASVGQEPLLQLVDDASTGSGKRFTFNTSTPDLPGTRSGHECRRLAGHAGISERIPGADKAQRLEPPYRPLVPDRLRLRQRTDDPPHDGAHAQSLIRQSEYALFWNPWGVRHHLALVQYRVLA